MSKKPCIGILGGTFDPIHHAHLRLALELRQNLALAKIHFLPCYLPVHRNQPVATTEQRVQMLENALTGQTFFYLDKTEIQNKKPCYAIDSILALREKNPGFHLAFIIGMDAFLNFKQWHRWHEILQHCHLIIVPRVGFELPTTGPLYDYFHEHSYDNADILQYNSQGSIISAKITPLAISATLIRNAFATHRNPQYLLPDSVIQYIKTHAIYT